MSFTGSILALVAAQVSTSAGTLSQTGKWAVAYEPTECLLSRPFGSGDGAVTLGLLRFPTSPGGTVLLVASGGDAQSRHGSGKIIIEPSGEQFSTDWTTAPRNGQSGSVTRIDPAVDFWKALHTATAFTIQNGRADPVRLAVGAMEPALSAYDRCNDELLRRWGADPAAMIVPGPWLASWLNNDSYPEAALKRRTQGRAVALISIDPDGRPASCKIVKSSGDADLDAASCAITRKPVRVPRNADDRAVARWIVLPINWRLP